jgi:DNA-directed RNA polymerase II subunit RPB11
MNAPDRFASYVLEDGERRAEYRSDERIPDAGTFTFNKETDTAGNLLRMQLLRNPAVKFCGYQMPHPLENKMLIKVQTNGTITPVDAFKTAVEDLESELERVDRLFRDEVAVARKAMEERKAAEKARLKAVEEGRAPPLPAAAAPPAMRGY